MMMTNNTPRFEILRNREKNVFYVWDYETDWVVQDEDGNTIYFTTPAEAYNYIADVFEYTMEENQGV
jgi:hypothetical protein